MAQGINRARDAVAQRNSKWTLSNVVGSFTGARGEPEIFVSVIDGDQVIDPRTVDFLQDLEVDAICVQPQLIPVANLLTAQAAIRHTSK